MRTLLIGNSLFALALADSACARVYIPWTNRTLAAFASASVCCRLIWSTARTN